MSDVKNTSEALYFPFHLVNCVVQDSLYLFVSKSSTKAIGSLMVLIFLSTTALAQQYRPLRVGFGNGFVSPNSNSIIGILVYVEPSWRVSDRIALGMRIESMGRLSNVGSSDPVNILGSYTLSGQYYFWTKGPARFFGGLGTGVYMVNRGGMLGTCTCEGVTKTNVFGIYPRLGIDIGHFVVDVEYNFVKSTRVRYYSDMPMMVHAPYVTAETSYLSLKTGFFLGGGKKRKVN